MRCRCVLLFALACAAALGFAQDQQYLRGLHEAFIDPPTDCRPMMRWWWFGPAVTRPGIEREMRTMKQGGIGGVEVQPVYPVVPDNKQMGVHNLPYLSEAFLDALQFTAAKAHELGLRFDLTLGSGWPYGGPQVSISDAAPRLRWERRKVIDGKLRVPVPDLTSGETLIAAFDAANRHELMGVHDQSDGMLRLPEGSRVAEVWFFISSRTGQQVKRAAVGAEGYVIDHYSRPALERYLRDVAEPMMAAVAATPPFAVFCDSLEVYGSDWSVDFLEQFRQRRGYDLRPRLPALVLESEESSAVRRDWGKTLTELLEESFFAPMQQWANAHGTLFRIQGYGVPPAALSSNALADLAEGEGHEWNRLTSARWASSANHLYGRPVTSSETWTWLHSPSFRATPLDMKVEADRHFLQGINQLIGHGWPYTVEGSPYPGGRFYAAGVFNEKNPWWIVMPDVSRYLQRLSFILRQGGPVNDVAIYLPTDDAYAHFSTGRVNLLEGLGERIGPAVVEQVLSRGYGFDFVDDRALEQLARIDNSSLVLGSNRYTAVVLPGVETMPVSTIRTLGAFAHAGGIVVATRRLPSRVPGLIAAETDHTELRDTVRRVFETHGSGGRFLEDESKLGETLAALVQPDLALSPPAPGIGFVHRSAAPAEIYFVVNTDNVRRETSATFRVEGLQPECWDALTGKVLPLRMFKAASGSLTVDLDLEPYGSRVMVFSHNPSSNTTARPGAQLPSVDLSRNWQVRFGDADTTLTMDQLRSWTDDLDRLYFSGLVTYEKTFQVPEAYLSTSARPYVSLGYARPVPDTQSGSRMPRLQALVDAPVREAAVVEVNGKRAGSAWCPPYTLDLTGFLKRGENRIRIVVGNLAINYMAGRAPADYRLLNLRYGTRFEPQDMDQVRPVPSGLLGPITLQSFDSGTERN